jgi:predicted permease
MIPILLAILGCTAAGVGSERRWGAVSQRCARAILSAMLFVLVPFESFFNIAHLHLNAGVDAGIGLAYVAVAITGCCAALLARKVFALEPTAAATFVCTVVVANTTYLGLPLVGTMLGAAQLPTAVAYDTLVSGPLLLLGAFGLGAAFGTRSGRTAKERRKAFLTRNPPLLAVIAGLLAPASLEPKILLSAAHAVVYALLPLGFFALGINLASAAESGLLRPPARLRAAVASAVALRMLLTPALLFGFSLLIGLPRAYLLQSAMPCGINTLIVAHAFGLDLRLASTTIAWSTLAAVAVVTMVVLVS